MGKYLFEDKIKYFCQTCGNSILQGTLVKDVGGEGTESRVHAVLDLQADWPDSQNHQSFKQRLGQTCLGCLLTHHNRSELAVVANKNKLK